MAPFLVTVLQLGRDTMTKANMKENIYRGSHSSREPESTSIMVRSMAADKLAWCWDNSWELTSLSTSINQRDGKRGRERERQTEKQRERDRELTGNGMAF